MPFKSYDNFDSLKTWSEVLARLDVYAAAMHSSLNQKDSKSISNAYHMLSSFIAFISVLAGITPGTNLSPFTNSEVARAYRHTITSLSKLGISNDIAKEKNGLSFFIKSRSASVVSGSSLSSISSPSRFSVERKFSVASEVSDHGELDLLKLGIRETNTLISKTKTFIKVFRQAVNLAEEDSLDKISLMFPLVSDDDSSVKQFRTGMWSELNEVSSSPTNKKNSLPLESFDTIIPFDIEVVQVLDHQRNMVVTILGQIFNLIDMKTSAQSTADCPARFLEDRRHLVLSSLNSLVSLVTNMSNLVESVDLSVFQSNRRKSSGTLFTSSSSVAPPPPPFILLCDFLEAKQALYDDLLAIVEAVQQSDINDQAFMDVLAQSLASTKISTSKTIEQHKCEDSDESEKFIKMRALELGVTIDSLVNIASALAEERVAILGFQSSDTYPSLTADNSIHSASSDSNTSFSRRPHKLSRSYSNSSLAPSTVSVNIPGRDDVPWYLEPDYDCEVVYDAKHHLRGGTLQALVERLTYHNSMNPTFNTAMLLTFRSFTTPQELFQELVRRFGIQPPEGLSQDEFIRWTDQKQKLVRLRVVNIMKKWLDEYWYEDCTAKSIQTLLVSMQAFAEQLQRQNNPGHEKITKLVEARLNSDDSTRRRLIQNSPVPPPSPILPRNVKKLKILDVDPLELARQLTLREFKLFEKITPFECLTRRQRKTKLRNNSIENTRHIDAFIHNSNDLTNWVPYMILKYSETKKRALAIKYFVTVAEYCRQYNNFSSMMAVISALYSATIHRMKKTWASVSEKTLETLDNMNKLMNSSRNFNEYRDILRMVTPPVIPFFGVYLSDLTFVEDGNPDFLQDSPNIINFAKRMKSAEIIREIMQYQIQHYVYQEVEAVQALLDFGFAKAPPIDAQYDTSLALEPRERTNERMARLLEETGYL